MDELCRWVIQRALLSAAPRGMSHRRAWTLVPSSWIWIQSSTDPSASMISTSSSSALQMVPITVDAAANGASLVAVWTGVGANLLPTPISAPLPTPNPSWLVSTRAEVKHRFIQNLIQFNFNSISIQFQFNFNSMSVQFLFDGNLK